MKIEKKKSHLLDIVAIVLIFGGAFLVSHFWYQFMLIQGESMLPNYHPYQLVILDKRQNEYHCDDVIAFRCEKLSSVLVKRVIAGPGDEVQIVNHVLFVNGVKDNLFFSEKKIDEAGLFKSKVKLNGNQYLVLGDNLEKSIDSRYEEVGIVSVESIIGKVLF